MRFGHLERSVRDPVAARDFYVGVLGFALVADQGADFQWVGLGDVEVLLRHGTGAVRSDRYVDGPGGLVLYVDDVAAEVERLAAAGVPMRGDDGASNPTFTDPDGHWFQLASPDG